MGMRGFFMVAIMLSTLLCYCESEEQLIELSRDELLEIENQLERLNKSSIKTIKTHYGDIYDCIDFYEQPAFDHPLLKNHKYDFQMKPSSHMAPMVREDKPPKNVRQVSINSGLKGEKCPIGFVPIRRTTKEDLIRAKLFTKSYTSRINSPPTSHHALVYTSDSTKKYNGGGTIASFYTLYNVTDSQYTFGRIKLQNGLDIIQAGWGVNPSVYGDNKTRIFIYFQAGELSCFNTVCPGFVLVDPQPMIDRILRETHPDWGFHRDFGHTQHGDICDCINFYEQPAFDHPLLKNHKYDFRMGPSSHPNPMVREDKPPKNVKQVSINSGLKGEKCPIRFIPIRRSTKEDLIRAKLFTKSYASRINSPPTFHIKSFDMGMRGFFMVAIMLSTLLCYCESEEQLIELSRDELLEIENQLERLNKSSIKTIKTHYGDIYDCIDFYEQPAFDHPLLKNHKYDFQGEKCPIGFVPIRRTTKEDLIRAKLFTKSYTSRINSPPTSHHALVYTSDSTKKYNGGGTIASFYTLYNVTDSQYTFGRIKLQNGLDIIQAGWGVNPSVYGDNKTRIFIYFQAGELSCFNTVCPGFVLVDPQPMIDRILRETHPGTFPTWEIGIYIYRTQHGDICDCINFYEQPAFDHPLLKNHKYDFRMGPSSHPNPMVREDKPPKNVKQVSINSGLKGEKCPIRFIPIRRSTKEDLIRAKLFTKSYASRINSPPTFHIYFVSLANVNIKSFNMGMRGFFMVAIMLSTLLCYCESEEQLIELSRDELLEIEDQLERLNKSSIKTIKTYYGDIYDCIDFYEQPAFDHPLLKNRKYDFQMKPSSHMAPMVREDKPPKNVRQVSINSGLKGEKCPTGFVPIRRTTKEDLIRAKLFTKSYTSRINSPPTSHHALVYTSDSTKKYNGGGTIASFYTLYNVTDSQYTFGRIKLQNGLDIIQAGWGVNPSVYGDNKTRIFIYFQAGELSCFNTVCPGFVLVDPQPMIDRILRETHPVCPVFVLVDPQPMIQMTVRETHPGNLPTWELPINMYRDPTTRNWWFQLGENYDHIGYWPSSIFSGGLKDLATYID
ncbi:hypothetical protein G4B88_019051 [Cannabis sativa]|uniref:Neprosin PEP catalytic domain-containing protein n=1 Tax=Cannabis sativa TaxID=3483 RepID=A0A7J6H0Q0_CANSA|nr:hypothetical protein G4B88_019051 [Cannabis sativa]